MNRARAEYNLETPVLMNYQLPLTHQDYFNQTPRVGQQDFIQRPTTPRVTRQTYFEHQLSQFRHQYTPLLYQNLSREEGSPLFKELSFSQGREESEPAPEVAEKTPVKIILEDELDPPTVRKESTGMSPAMVCIPENRFSEKGLKKLAKLAYAYVSQQKKTTYKDVARKLIEQLNADHEISIQRSGELNVKRRVYDALNVIIALGILERNGNKIYGKKTDRDRTKPKKNGNGAQKEDLLKEELQQLKGQMAMKEQVLQEKRKIIAEMKQKQQALAYIIERNRNEMPQGSLGQIAMPILMICGQSKESHTQVPLIKVRDHSDISIQLETDRSCRMQSIGDLDVARLIYNTKKRSK